jgi:hypothetical protein
VLLEFFDDVLFVLDCQSHSVLLYR